VTTAAESFAPPRLARLLRLRRVGPVEQRPVTLASLLACWRSALDAACAATASAFEQRALDSAARRGYEQRLRLERDWVGTLERKSALSDLASTAAD